MIECYHDHTTTACNNWGECVTFCEDCEQEVQMPDDIDPEAIITARDEAAEAEFNHRHPL